MREYDLTIATENVFAELLDLQAEQVDPHEVGRTRSRTCWPTGTALWTELTAEEEFTAEEMWRIEQRIERLNQLGFDVEELDIVTDFDGDKVRIQPRWSSSHHPPRAAVADRNQRRGRPGGGCSTTSPRSPRFELGREDRMLVANGG